MKNLLWIAAGGALGTLARYGIGRVVGQAAPSTFPWGTLIANLVGCFFFGLVWSLGERHLNLNGTVRTVVLVGFMGGLTTFSSFIFDTNSFLCDAHWMLAIAKVAGEVVLAVVALTLGVRLGGLV